MAPPTATRSTYGRRPDVRRTPPQEGDPAVAKPRGQPPCPRRTGGSAPEVRCPPGRRSPESPEDSQIRCGDAIDAQPDQLVEARAVIDRPRQNQQFVPV